MGIKGFSTLAALSALALLGSTALAQPSAAPAPGKPPKLLVVISVDQYSTNVFDEYRRFYTGGLKRLQDGVVFPNGFQSHAATETCPGHSTILTGNRPEHTGIIANSWIDQSIAREDKTVYCAEDTGVPGTSSRDYAPSVVHLRVPTLGGRMKDADPRSKVISVAGKDRAAIMMGGPRLDQVWWWNNGGFTSYRGTPLTPLIERVNAGVSVMLNQDSPGMDLPEVCAAHDYPVAMTPQVTIGTGRLARKAGDDRAFRTSPAFDAAVLVLAQSLIEDQKLGQGPATDIISIGLSATDYVGHAYGTEGTEMCIQTMALDNELGAFFDRLDATGIDYMVALTADHGGADAVERMQANGIPDAARLTLSNEELNKAVAEETGLSGTLLLGETELYASTALSLADRKRVIEAAQEILGTHPQVAAVFTKDQLIAADEPAGPPETWSLLARAKASFDAERSGDLIVLTKARVSHVSRPGPGYASGHGTPWDYDRNVPIIFWRKGMAPYEQPQGVETVDILPTLAAQIGLPVDKSGIDGRCLDLIPGAGDSCPAK